MFRERWPLLPLLFLCACPATPEGAADGGVPGADAAVTADSGVPGMDAAPPVEFPESGKAQLRFKRSERLEADLAQALGLAPEALCNELGQYSCARQVHTIALGGVEPFELGIREGLANTTVTAPLAVERLAFSGCIQRVDGDLADPGRALIFVRGLELDAAGAIPDPAGQVVRESITNLYRRTALRDPRESEVAHLIQLYRDVAATQEPRPGRDWAVLACVAVLSSLESLFY